MYWIILMVSSVIILVDIIVDLQERQDFFSAISETRVNTEGEELSREELEEKDNQLYKQKKTVWFWIVLGHIAYRFVLYSPYLVALSGHTVLALVLVFVVGVLYIGVPERYTANLGGNGLFMLRFRFVREFLFTQVPFLLVLLFL